MRIITKSISETGKKICSSLSDIKNRESFFSAFLSTLIIGYIVHFYMLANSYLNHDTIHYYSNNGEWLIQQGKWFVTPINSITGPYTLRYLDGAIGLVAIALIAGVICWMYSVPKGILCWSIGGVLVSFPSVATMLIYEGLDYFAIASLLAVLAAFFLVKSLEIFRILGVICLVFSLGAYQPFLGFTLSLLVVDCIIMHARNTHVKTVVCKGIRYIIDAIISLSLYYVILKIRLYQSGLSLIEYKGINHMSENLSPVTLIRSAIEAYKDVCSFFIFDCFGIHGKHFCLLYTVAILLVIIGFLYYSYYNNALANKKNVFLAIILGIIIPLSVNIVGVLSSNSSFYYITIYPFVIICLLSVIVLSLIINNARLKGNNSSKNISKFMQFSVVGILLLLCCKWTVQDNIAYQKLGFANKQITSKLTVLEASIQNTDGFTTDTPVVIFGDVPIPLYETLTVSSSLDALNTEGMTVGNAQLEMNDRNLTRGYLNVELGVEYNYIDSETILNSYRDTVDEMAVYPDKGSIRMVDNMIFVKLSDNNSQY
jgi:hypothetical protein